MQPEQQQAGGVTLWDLLTLIAFVTPIGGAIAGGQHQILSHRGTLAWVCATIVGIVLGLCFAATMRYALIVVGSRLQGSTNRVVAFVGIGMLSAAIVWLGFGDFVGYRAATSIFKALA